LLVGEYIAIIASNLMCEQVTGAIAFARSATVAAPAEPSLASAQ
jgi:hypothetical protein